MSYHRIISDIEFVSKAVLPEVGELKDVVESVTWRSTFEHNGVSSVVETTTTLPKVGTTPRPFVPLSEASDEEVVGWAVHATPHTLLEVLKKHAEETGVDPDTLPDSPDVEAVVETNAPIQPNEKP